MSELRPDRTLGPGHDEFWGWCAKGELRLQRCDRCSRLSWPVVASCDFCGGTEFSWSPLSGRGKLVSWCTFEREYYKGLLPVPWDTILVELEEGALFIGNPLGFSWRDIEPDMPVKLAFVECRDSAGAFSLPVFERA